MIAKVIALAGANGHVGKTFARELLNQGFELRILARADSSESAALQELKASGASVHAISYDNEASIFKALQGADVLISTVSGTAFTAQVPLIKAAKTAEIKLFFPSEYGGVYEDDFSFVQVKKSILEAARDAGLPLAIVSNGAFPEYCFVPPFGFNFAEKKVTVWGDGNAKASWTTVHSVADWIANVLRTVPIEQLQNQHFRIQGSSVTVNEIIALWEQKHGTKLDVEYRPLKELDDRLNANKDDVFAFLLGKLFSGAVEVGGEHNSLYRDWKPESLEAIL